MVNSEQNYTIPTLIVVVILHILSGQRNYDMGTVHCAEALRTACEGFELPHVVSDIIQRRKLHNLGLEHIYDNVAKLPEDEVDG